MGTKVGRGRGWHSGMGRTIALACLIIVTQVGCQVGKPVVTQATWVRQVEARPQLVMRCYYGPAEGVKQMIEELQDVARPVRGVTRLGNGAVALGFQNERGRWLRAFECGGMLLVEGAEGQPYRLVVENKTDVILEVLPSVDGLDLQSGTALELKQRGRMMPPRGKTVFDAISGADGKAAPLKFRAVKGTQALYQISSTGTLGAVQLAVFLGQGTDTFDARPPLARRNRARSFPDRQFEPMLLPYQYR